MGTTACPISTIARILGRRWTIEVLYLMRRNRRFSDLQMAAGGLNPSTLTIRLRELEHAGLVRRTLVSTEPVQIEYGLTDKGRALDPALDALAAWSQCWENEEGTAHPRVWSVPGGTRH